jgi:hypothetical protein
MQAIKTTYHGPTNFKGGRIKAQCERGSIFISYPDELNTENAHIAAVDALIAKFIKEDEARYGTNKNPWSAPRVCGGLKDCYVHVFTA